MWQRDGRIGPRGSRQQVRVVSLDRDFRLRPVFRDFQFRFGNSGICSRTAVNILKWNHFDYCFCYCSNLLKQNCKFYYWETVCYRFQFFMALWVWKLFQFDNFLFYFLSFLTTLSQFSHFWNYSKQNKIFRVEVGKLLISNFSSQTKMLICRNGFGTINKENF